MLCVIRRYWAVFLRTGNFEQKITEGGGGGVLCRLVFELNRCREVVLYKLDLNEGNYLYFW